MTSVQQECVTIPLSQIKAWFFDLDGTLMDTDDQAVEALARRLQIAGRRRARRWARRLVMLSETPMNHLLTGADILGLDPLFFSLSRRFSKSRHDHHTASPAFPIIKGIVPLIRFLATRCPLAVVSTRSQTATATFLREHALVDHFTLQVTCETTQRLKPHPEPVAYAARHLKLPPHACVMVGDTPVDMLSARRAGAWAIGVLCGFGEERELWRAGAHMVLPTTADILTLLKYQTPPAHIRPDLDP